MKLLIFLKNAHLATDLSPSSGISAAVRMLNRHSEGLWLVVFFMSPKKCTTERVCRYLRAVP